WRNLSRGLDLTRYTVKPLFDPAEPFILGNRVQIETAIRMLIQNAIEATEESLKPKRTIRGQTVVRGKHVTLRVADSGTGMDETTLKEAFRPFFTTKDTGSGLGLAIVDWVARGHRAKIIVTSRVGWGTSIKIHFPLEPECHG